MSERRVRALFLLVLAGQLLLLTSRVPDRLGDGSALEGISLRLLAPFARGVDALAEVGARGRERLRLRGQLQAENRALQAEVERLRVQAMRQQDLADEARRLARALDYSRRGEIPFRLADVVLSNPESWLRTLVVHTGPPAVRAYQPVVTNAGLVGCVIKVGGSYAKVQLVLDRAARVGAMIERNRRQGLVRGDGEGGLEMDEVPLQVNVEAGDRVVTSGIDGVFPRGIPLGSVAEVAAGSELFHRIRVLPAVDFGLLDQVYILEVGAVPTDLGERGDDGSR
jgi:rod shape-determining protein MreC